MSYSYLDSENMEETVDDTKNMDYDEIRDLVTSPNNRDVYTALMNKENKVLNVINKVADNENKKKINIERSITLP